MRRTSLALVPLLVLGLLVAVPSAARADTTLVSKTGLPDGWSFTDTRVDGRPGDSSYAHVEGPAGVPTGIGSLQLNHGTHTFKLGLNVDFTPNGAATAWATDEVTYRSTAEIIVDLGFYSPSLEQQAIVYLPATSAWSTVDLLAQPIHLVGDPHEQDYGTTTWSKLVADHPGGTVRGLYLQVRTLRTAATTWVDTVRYGMSGNVTTVDFDTDPIPVLTSSTATVTLPAGTTTPLSGRVKRPSGAPIAGLPVQLWQKVWGTGVWALATTVTSNADGSFATMVKPQKATYYQWRVTEPGYAAATSATRRVDVRARLWFHVADTTVSATTRIVAYGRIAPALVGRTVTLHRVGSTSALAYAKVRGDLRYSFSRTLPRGTWTLYATVATGGGVLGTKSVGVRVVVS